MQQILDTRTAASRPAPTSLAARFLHWLLEADRRHREARALGRMSDEQLSDIGRSHVELERMRRASRLG